MKNAFQFKSVRMKILTGFIIIMILVLGMGVLTYLGIKDNNAKTAEITETQLPLLNADTDLNQNISAISSLIRGYVLEDDEAIKEELQDTIKEGDKIEEHIQKISQNSKIDHILEKKQEWEDLIEQTIDANEKGDKKAAREYLEEARPISLDVINDMDELTVEKKENVDRIGKEALSKANATVIFNLVIVAVVIVASVFIALFTARSIVNPIQLVMTRMKALSEGDLTNESLETNLQDEVGELIKTTNYMSDTLRNLLTNIQKVSGYLTNQSEALSQSAEEVNSGTEQIATTMEELASGAETQANSATDLTQNMSSFTTLIAEANSNGEQIETQSNHVLTMTGEGSQLMGSSSKQMEIINQIVKESVDKMAALNKQSEEISNLVQVIQSISDQTNLLALNAAIEAARAGEHGKGFAVVADEVRKLAEQVSFSVNDITGIVENIQSETSMVSDSLEKGFQEVTSGTEQINTTEATFNEIYEDVTQMVTSIQTISRNLAEIVAGSEEMGQSIEDIAAISEEAAAGVEQTAASAQQASSSVEEVADSSKQLREQAEQLNQLVDTFKL